MSKTTEKSDQLYDAIDKAIAANTKGMTTFQIMGVLQAITFRFWERFSSEKARKKPNDPLPDGRTK